MSDAPVPPPPLKTSRGVSATIQPGILRYLIRVAEEHGVDLRPELTRLGLDEAVMRSAALRVSYRQGSAVIRRAVELTGDEHLGLRVGSAQQLTAWGMLGFAQMASETLQDAIETGVRYQNLSGSMVVWSVRSEDTGYVMWADLPDPAVDPAVATFLVEEAFSSVVTLTRLSTGPEFAPQAVEFAFPAPRDTELLAELFRCPMRFSADRNRMVLPNRWAHTAMPGRDPVTYAAVVEVLDAQTASRRAQQDLLEVLEISIAQSLPVVPSFAEQARRHASSERTLRRRLAECGTTYEAIVDGVRRERVEQLLLRPESTLRDVARQAGFSDVSALRRAVRRWHGVAPMQLRGDIARSAVPLATPAQPAETNA
ncbi:AraC family transcriptional regulator [Streptomyces sp. DT2A-34]|uniref:AraC family transcriptional regulator n=1 Tax=Streptomyces sp. DT2A-34 TaxID=3051182 RepID=UPI00265C3666|nr:AraC family transcriptional regulator [Streptomyces sp. DT2A-34]MDO0916654.1 AraC family transcriptional regulator [Streptomyces sp. DT2A-34]